MTHADLQKLFARARDDFHEWRRTHPAPKTTARGRRISVTEKTEKEK